MAEVAAGGDGREHRGAPVGPAVEASLGDDARVGDGAPDAARLDDRVRIALADAHMLIDEGDPLTVREGEVGALRRVQGDGGAGALAEDDPLALGDARADGEGLRLDAGVGDVGRRDVRMGTTRQRRAAGRGAGRGALVQAPASAAAKRQRRRVLIAGRP